MSAAHEIIRLLDDWGMRYQDPTIQRTTGENPRWIIRPVVPVIGPGGMVRRQKVITLGMCAEMTKKEAQREKQRIMAEINGGVGIIQGQLLLRDLISKFREARMPLLTASTQRKYDHHLRNHIAELADLKLHELTPDVIQSWLLGKPLAPATKADIKNLLSALFEQARRWRMWSDPNPVHDVEIGRMLPAREKFIPTEAQVRDLRVALDHCGADTEGITGPDVRLMVDLVIATGWRISEVLGLKSDALQGTVAAVLRRWHRGELVDAPKTAAGVRRNYIGPELAAELAARPAGEFLFQGSAGVPPDDRSIQQYILRPCAVAVGCYRPGFGFHSLRRLNITWRAEAGANPFEVARAAGHTKVETSLLYTITDQGREKDVVEKIQRRVQ